MSRNFQIVKKMEKGISRIRKDGQDLYLVEVSRRTKSGKRRRIYRRRIVKGFEQAKEAREDLFQEIKAAIAESTSLTFRQFLDDDYLRFLEGQRRPSTFLRERCAIAAHLIPPLGDRPLDKITAEECETVIDHACAGKKAQTRKHLINYLNAIFKRALKRRKVLTNPCDLIDRPSRKDINRGRKFTALTRSQAETLLAWMRENEAPCFYHAALALLTFSRAGELRALTWNDVDLENRAIYIRKTLDSKTGLKWSTKTDENRVIPINDSLLEILLELHSETLSTPDSPVLPYWKEFEAGEQGKGLKPILQALKLPIIRWHCLRATGITLALEAGEPLAKVAKVAGHKRLSTTEIYYRSTIVAVKGAMDRMNLSIPNKPKNASVKVPELKTRKVIDIDQRKRGGSTNTIDLPADLKQKRAAVGGKGGNHEE